MKLKDLKQELKEIKDACVQLQKDVEAISQSAEFNNLIKHTKIQHKQYILWLEFGAASGNK